MFDPLQSKRIDIKSTTCERDLGVYVDKELKFSRHTSTQVNKANRLVGLIRRSFTYLDVHSFKTLFITLVRPHLEYCGTIYNPRLLKDKRQVENVLRRSLKMIPGLKDLTYCIAVMYIFAVFTPRIYDHGSLLSRVYKSKECFIVVKKTLDKPLNLVISPTLHGAASRINHCSTYQKNSPKDTKSLELIAGL